MMPQLSDIASTIRSPLPVGSVVLGERSVGAPAPPSCASTRIRRGATSIASSKLDFACWTQLVASSLTISSTSSTVAPGSSQRHCRTKRRAALTASLRGGNARA